MFFAFFCYLVHTRVIKHKLINKIVLATEEIFLLVFSNNYVQTFKDLKCENKSINRILFKKWLSGRMPILSSTYIFFVLSFSCEKH